MIKWSLKEVPLNVLREHSKNPRQIGKEQMRKLGDLIEKFGLIDKPIVNADYTIIGGHQRVKVMKKQKAKEIECWVSETLLSDKEVDELCVGLNLHQGKWDWDMLANQWEPLDLLEYGFSEDMLTGMCKEAEETIEKQKNSSKKQKICPNCGCEM